VRTVLLFRAIHCAYIIKQYLNATLTSSFCRQRPVVQHQIITASASPALIKCRLSAENATACTQPLCPVNTKRQRPVRGFHSRTVLSHEPDACNHTTTVLQMPANHNKTETSSHFFVLDSIQTLKNVRLSY